MRPFDTTDVLNIESAVIQARESVKKAWIAGLSKAVRNRHIGPANGLTYRMCVNNMRRNFARLQKQLRRMEFILDD